MKIVGWVPETSRSFHNWQPAPRWRLLPWLAQATQPWGPTRKKKKQAPIKLIKQWKEREGQGRGESPLHTQCRGTQRLIHLDIKSYLTFQCLPIELTNCFSFFPIQSLNRNSFNEILLKCMRWVECVAEAANKWNFLMRILKLDGLYHYFLQLNLCVTLLYLESAFRNPDFHTTKTTCLNSFSSFVSTILENRLSKFRSYAVTLVWCWSDSVNG